MTSAQARFWGRVERDDESRCLLWAGFRDAGGYGHLRVARRDVLAHRFAFEQARGVIPEGMVVHHRCGRRACVHPLHLALMTHADHSRFHNPRSAMCPRCGGGDWRDLPSGGRVCRTCQARWRRERYATDPVFRETVTARTRAWRRRRREGRS